MQETESTAEPQWEAISSRNKQTNFSSNMTPKKYKQYTMLLTSFLALFFIINQKHYIEELINNFFYIEETTLQPN